MILIISTGFFCSGSHWTVQSTLLLAHVDREGGRGADDYRRYLERWVWKGGGC